MSRIICITGEYPVYDKSGNATDRKELLVSHGINEDTDEHITLPWLPPQWIGAVWDVELQEWILK